MKRGWLASLLAAAVVLPMAAHGADVTKTADSTPTVKSPSKTSDTTAGQLLKGRLPQFYAKLPAYGAQRDKIYEIEATFAPKIKASRPPSARDRAGNADQGRAYAGATGQTEGPDRRIGGEATRKNFAECCPKDGSDE